MKRRQTNPPRGAAAVSRRGAVYFLLAFAALALPYVILLSHSYANLAQESFFFYRRTAESVIGSVGLQLKQALRDEEQRSYTEYRYIHVPERSLPSQEGLNISPLAALPAESDIPGILGYFQIDPDGSFHTPLLPDNPADSALAVPQLEERRKLESQLRAIVEQGRFPVLARGDRSREERESALSPGPSEPETKLKSNLATNADLRLKNQYLAETPAKAARAELKKESEAALQQRRVEPSSERQAVIFDDELRGAYRESLPPAQEEAAASGSASSTMSRDQAGARNNLGEMLADEKVGSPLGAEVDPFQVQLVDNQWIILERKVWWNERRYIQGLVGRLDSLAAVWIQPAMLASALPEESGFLLFHDGDLVLSSTSNTTGERPILLENSGLPAPFSTLNLAITVPQLPSGPGRNVIDIIAVLAALMITGGTWGAYRLTAKQWELSRRQRDFVSAISHELKSPLTSIRMYGEMLMEGWVEDEEKKQSYYRRIHDESERLTRLIQNVLRLAQVERGQWEVKLAEEDPVELVNALVKQLEKPVSRAGFEIEIETEGNPSNIFVDQDAFTQILINLTDNSLKFAAGSPLQKILIRVLDRGSTSEIRVRDFGPGIPRGERKRIFQQFYRVGSEMTRQTQGTGLGLALVKILMEAMGGSVKVSNQHPGAEFCLVFPASAGTR